MPVMRTADFFVDPNVIVRRPGRMNCLTRGSSSKTNAMPSDGRVAYNVPFSAAIPSRDFSFCEMRGTDVRDKAAGRVRDAAEVENITWLVRAHFNDDDFMASIQIQQCRRQSQVIVQISRRPQDLFFVARMDA